MNIANGTKRVILLDENDMIIWFSDSHAEAASYADTLIRHGRVQSVYSMYQSWNTYGCLWEEVNGTKQKLH